MRKKYIPLINWNEICKLQENRGTRIRKTVDVSTALQLKLLRKITVEPDNIWVNFIKEKYLKESSLFIYKKKGSTSWQWGKLMDLRPVFFQGLR